MKVVAFNGSPKKEGNTYHALKMVGDELKKNGIDFEIIHVGNKVIRGCIACGQCAKNKNEQCALKTDDVNEWIQVMKEADGILLGSPVHFAGIAGTMKSFLDRVFYVHSTNGGLFRHKVGAAVVSVRRSGGSVTFDGLNHYLNYAEMYMPTTNYWNIIHGGAPAEVYKDDEGMQIMSVLGKNMAHLMKVLENSKTSAPVYEPKVFTNFIR
ncbi:flavodoxin family protein [Niameybacter massiliensis]|uniref:Flavodoxin family protein n=1 Tax=Holtiella tumoricola TaxID=3018743 RepID=A0AA42DMK0_9FIRM|nr:flavodoxin family protein [Holtiella tumoricola]MDA3731708.1 flavodoxin family protein [Holtiella tumoricola]